MDLRDDSAERTPLLQEQSDSSFPSYNVQARDELPPPYSPQYATQGNIVPCRVCGYVIDITNRRDQHVVKCSRCNEATPIRHAPHGKKLPKGQLPSNHQLGSQYDQHSSCLCAWTLSSILRSLPANFFVQHLEQCSVSMPALQKSIISITLGITLGTYQYAVEKKGIYVVYACGLIAFLLFLLRSLYYLTMRVSHIEEPA
ncbi:hypothetical protein MTO96_001328 [Rhipicephalus appendiculatus]